MGKLTYLKDVIRNTNSAVTVGTFDGVHLGHRILLEKLVTKAKEINGKSVVVSFDPHPREVLQGGNNTIKLLTTLSERAEMLRQLGVDEMVVIPFDRDFSLMSSEDFIEKIVYQKIGLKHFIIGYDHQFGKNREGSIATVKKLGEMLDFQVHLINAQEVGDITVSSTTVRKALANEGNVGLATSFLGRPYLLSGMVVHGDKRGRLLGFPTANIKVNNERKIIPARGVYAVEVEFEGNRFNGMMNIGLRPTVANSTELRLEVHIFDFNEQIYGKMLTVYFKKRIRDEQRFEGVEALKKQLIRDKEDCISFLKTVY
jgi:riboflavin kinase/FMN adenylyltransferase